jgi:hypothetical protein
MCCEDVDWIQQLRTVRYDRFWYDSDMQMLLTREKHCVFMFQHNEASGVSSKCSIILRHFNTTAL